MNPIRGLEDFRYFTLRPDQHWYYVILANAADPTPAARSVLNNLDMFDLDTGRDCDYFLPGFICNGCGLMPKDLMQYGVTPDHQTVYLERLGEVPFSGRDFVRFYRQMEEQGKRAWRYSGRCELLIFTIDAMSGRVDFSDFYSYDLDDIVTNRRSISEFIRGMIMISQDGCSKEEAKRRLDEIYYDMVMPQEGQYDTGYLQSCVRAFERSGFPGSRYCFISYSTRDFDFVKKVHDLLEAGGVKCWMAPFDIPRGTSYPYIIENAILHASAFILMLSRQSVQSVWVEKELLRAISRFAQQSPEKICVAWCGGQFPLTGTAFALPLENIQIKVDLGSDPENWRLLLPAAEECTGAQAETGARPDDQAAADAGSGAETGPAPGRRLSIFARPRIRRIAGYAIEGQMDFWLSHGERCIRQIDAMLEDMKTMLDMADLPQIKELYRALLRQHGNLAGTVQMARGRGCPATDQLAEEVEKTIRLLRICSREIQRLTE